MLIELQKSIIPSCDVPNLKSLENLVSETCNIKGIGAYKIGFELVLTYGLRTVIDTIREYTDIKIIYDHQKGGIDIPKMGKRFARVCKTSGVDAVILFPFAGPTSETVWIKECQDKDLTVLVGGYMSHLNFIENDNGFICDRAPERIYKMAVKCGIKDFVVPFNIHAIISKCVKMFKENYTLYSPGFDNDINNIMKYRKMVGDSNYHIIIGSAIYDPLNKQIHKTTKYFVDRVVKTSRKSDKELFSTDKVKCQECGTSMELIGVTDKGMWKYYCNNCYTITEGSKNA